MWEKLLEKMKPGKPKSEAAPSPGRMQNPGYIDAQKRATSYYFRTGEKRPIEDFEHDPNLK